MIWAIDPGLDAVAIAVLSEETYREKVRAGSVTAPLQAWVVSVLIRTSPRTPLPDRLGEIRSAIEDLLETRPPAAVYVEVPAYAGQYARGGQQTRGGVNGLYLGTGAVLSSVAGRGFPVKELKAGRAPKRSRHTVLEAMSRGTRIKLPEGPRGGKREDELDALWIGCWALGKYHGVTPTKRKKVVL
jgi:Holliday junction resolvasome RuvABC endonuclease subunit